MTVVRPQHVGTPNTSQEVTGVIWGLEGNTPRNDLYVIPISYEKNGPNNRYIVMFGPITNTSFKGDEAQPKYRTHGDMGWGGAP